MDNTWPVRLFVAVCPPEEVLALVGALPRPNLEKLRWTTRDQWHVTLRFLGEVDRAEGVARALAEVPEELGGSTAGPLEAVLGPVVAWFTGRRILQVPVAGIEELARIVSAKTAKWTEQPEHGPYSGHLTLARVRGAGRGPANLAGTPIHAAWKVEEFVLFSSTLGAGGARYEILEKISLPAPEP
jgi:RNA 2',3'-cyclic 3'-phosphodiesterase